MVKAETDRIISHSTLKLLILTALCSLTFFQNTGQGHLKVMDNHDAINSCERLTEHGFKKTTTLQRSVEVNQYLGTFCIGIMLMMQTLQTTMQMI